MRIGLHKDNYVDANSMNRQVYLFRCVKVADNQGGYETFFELKETVWGDFRPQDQNRTLLDSSITFNRSAKLFIRYDVEIYDDYKIQVEDEIYTIHSIKNVDNARRFYEILMYF